MKGNVIDLAVGVIMGAAFAPIVSALVENMMMTTAAAPPAPTASEVYLKEIRDILAKV